MMSKTPEKKILRWLSRPHIKPYLLAAFSSALVYFQASYDPFGLVSSTDRVSALVVSSVIAPFYGDQHHTGRDNIVVVLYDKAYFEKNKHRDKSEHQHAWPLVPDQHRPIIEKIAGANPAGVFLDVYFTSQNLQREEALGKFYQGLNDLNCTDGASSIECAETSQAAIFLASLLSDPKPQALDVSPARPVLAQTRSKPHLYRLTETIDDNSSSCKSDRQNTAAYALYEQWCKRKNELYADSCEPISSSKLDHVMYLQWGYAPSEIMHRYLENSGKGSSNCQHDTHGLQTVIEAAKLSLDSLFGRTANKKGLCAYHTTISAQYLKEMPRKELSDLVQHKIVLIGARDYPAADEIESYVHGKLPGVFWHAAALDNLIERQNDFLRVAPDTLGVILETTTSALLLFIMAAFIHQNLITEQQLIKSGRTSPSEKKLKSLNQIQLATAAIAICLLAGLLCLVWVVRGYAPQNWIGTAGLLIILCSDQAVAVHRVSVRWAIITITRPLQALASFANTFRPSINSVTLEQLNRSSKVPNQSHMLLKPLQILRVIGFILIGMMMIVGFISLAAILFFAPIVYFSIKPSTPAAISIFSLSYGLLIFIAFRYWLKKTLKIRRKNRKTKSPIIRKKEPANSD